MNKTQNLLVCLIEECSEVQKAATKALRFGLDNEYEDYCAPRKVLNAELIDLVAIIEMLEDNGVIESIYQRDLLQLKKAKVNKYMKYSCAHGQLV